MESLLLGTDKKEIPAEIMEQLIHSLREEYPQAETIDIWAVVDAHKRRGKKVPGVRYKLLVQKNSQAGVLELSPEVGQSLKWQDKITVRVIAGKQGRMFLIKPVGPAGMGFPVKVKKNGGITIRLPWPKNGFWNEQEQESDHFKVENGKISIAMKEPTFELFQNQEEEEE